MKHLKLTPLDTLFFRDGRPFNAGETGQMEVGSVFPPSANTVVGCLRAAFAKELGWNGHGAWDSAIIGKLGNGPKLEPLMFQEPYLLKDEECLFPVPAHLLAAYENEKMAHLTFLRPSDEALECDLSAIQPSIEAESKNPLQRVTEFFSPNSETVSIRKVRLPETLPVVSEGENVTGFKPLGQAYLTLMGMQQVLVGEKPALEDIIVAKDLWSSEARIGIQRNNKTRTTEEGALYQVAQTRLTPGVSLGMGVSGYEGDIPQSATLGGESRMAWLEPVEGWSLPEKPALVPDGDVLRYVVVLLTPTQLTGWHTPGSKLADLPGIIVSACVGKPVLIGGWDSVKRAPKDLQAYLPAGSVFFMEVRADDPESNSENSLENSLKAIQNKHNTHIGTSTDWGYGQIFIGVWP